MISPCRRGGRAVVAGDRLRSRRRRACLAVVALSAVLAVVSTPASARADWAPVAGLPGLGASRIWSLAFGSDPKLAFAATDDGIYRSVDSGQTWTPTSVRGTTAWTVGVDTLQSDAVYAGLAGGGIERSTDHGATWTAMTDGLPDRTVRAFAFGTSAVAAATDDGVAISPDGVHWRPDGLAGYAISSIAVVANAPQLTLVAGADQGDLTRGFLFRGGPTATSWTPAQSALPTTASVSAIAAGPLPAGGSYHPLLVLTSKGAFRSGDGATTWSASTGGVPQGVTLTTAAFTPQDPNIVYAAADAGGSSGGDLLRSTDAGVNFSVADAGLPGTHGREVVAIAVAATSPPHVLAALDPAGAPASIYKLDDGAVSPSGATASEPAGATLPAAAAPASAAPTPRVSRPAPAARARVSTSSGGGAFAWPFPLALEILVVVIAVTWLIRHRLSYLDVEGPP